MDEADDRQEERILGELADRPVVGVLENSDEVVGVAVPLRLARNAGAVPVMHESPDVLEPEPGHSVMGETPVVEANLPLVANDAGGDHHSVSGVGGHKVRHPLPQRRLELRVGKLVHAVQEKEPLPSIEVVLEEAPVERWEAQVRPESLDGVIEKPQARLLLECLRIPAQSYEHWKPVVPGRRVPLQKLRLQTGEGEEAKERRLPRSRITQDDVAGTGSEEGQRILLQRFRSLVGRALRNDPQRDIDLLHLDPSRGLLLVHGHANELDLAIELTERAVVGDSGRLDLLHMAFTVRDEIRKVADAEGGNLLEEGQQLLRSPDVKRQPLGLHPTSAT